MWSGCRLTASTSREGLANATVRRFSQFARMTVSFLRLERISAFHPLLKCGSGHEADSGTAGEIYVMRVAEAISDVQLQLAYKSLLSRAAVVEAKPIAAFEQLSHAP